MSAEGNESSRDKLIRARNGDAAAREELVSENLGLVKYIVKRFMNRGVEYDDLFQYGCLGLLKAIDRFDPDYPVQFSTYAVPVVMGEIRRFLRDDGPVHVSRTIREHARRVAAFTEAYGKTEQRPPGIADIAAGTGLTREEVLLAINSARRVRSLSEPAGPEGDLRLMDVLGQDTMAAVDRSLTLNQLLEELPEADRVLIVRRYFKSHTQTQIARDMGISQVQVSRLESRILKRMRAMAGG